MLANELDPRRNILCGRLNAERVAVRLSEKTGEDHAVVRTTCELQPFCVLPAADGDPQAIELQVVML